MTHISQLSSPAVDPVHYHTAACDSGPHLQFTNKNSYSRLQRSFNAANLSTDSYTNLFGCLFGPQVRLILVGRRRLGATRRLVEEFPQTLSVISNRTVVVPECWTVVGRHRLWTSCGPDEAVVKILKPTLRQEGSNYRVHLLFLSPFFILFFTSLIFLPIFDRK